MLRLRQFRGVLVVPAQSSAVFAGDPERLRTMIERRKALLKKAGAAPPKAKPITDYYVPYEYRNAENTYLRREKKDMPENAYSADEETIIRKNWSTYAAEMK